MVRDPSSGSIFLHENSEGHEIAGSLTSRRQESSTPRLRSPRERGAFWRMLGATMGMGLRCETRPKMTVIYDTRSTKLLTPTMPPWEYR